MIIYKIIIINNCICAYFCRCKINVIGPSSLVDNQFYSFVSWFEIV